MHGSSPLQVRVVKSCKKALPPVMQAPSGNVAAKGWKGPGRPQGFHAQVPRSAERRAACRGAKASVALKEHRQDLPRGSFKQPLRAKRAIKGCWPRIYLSARPAGAGRPAPPMPPGRPQSVVRREAPRRLRSRRRPRRHRRRRLGSAAARREVPQRTGWPPRSAGWMLPGAKHTLRLGAARRGASGD